MFKPKFFKFEDFVNKHYKKKDRLDMLLLAIDRKFPYTLGPDKDCRKESIQYIEKNYKTHRDTSGKIYPPKLHIKEYCSKSERDSEIEYNKKHYENHPTHNEMWIINNKLTECGEKPVFSKKEIFFVMVDKKFDENFFKNILVCLTQNKSQMSDITTIGKHRFCELAFLFYTIDMTDGCTNWQGIRTWNLIGRQFERLMETGDMCCANIENDKKNGCPFNITIKDTSPIDLYWIQYNYDKIAKKYILPKELYAVLSNIQWLNGCDGDETLAENSNGRRANGILPNAKTLVKTALTILINNSSYAHHEGCGIKHLITRVLYTGRSYISSLQMSKCNQLLIDIQDIPCKDCYKDILIQLIPRLKNISKEIWDIIFGYMFKLYLKNFKQLLNYDGREYVTIELNQ